VLDLLREMCKNPVTARAWRGTVSDIFSDNRFFNSPPSISAKWKPIVHALIASDKERFPELIRSYCLVLELRLAQITCRENIHCILSKHLYESRTGITKSSIKSSTSLLRYPCWREECISYTITCYTRKASGDTQGKCWRNCAQRGNLESAHVLYMC